MSTTTTTTNQINISSATVKRLISDIKEITLNPLEKDGIYYRHDETNMLLGYALIIGPPDTPYAYGNFLFKFSFPTNYPHSPPVVTYCTNDGITRFNPNLYKNGKVCISLLNTWKGEQWTGCQTISSILLVLCCMLNNKPLLNEPGITEIHKDFEIYNTIIKYKTLEVAVGWMIDKEKLPDEFHCFHDDIMANFRKNYDAILSDLTGKESGRLSCGMYGMSFKTNYEALQKLLIKKIELN